VEDEIQFSRFCHSSLFAQNALGVRLLRGESGSSVRIYIPTGMLSALVSELIPNGNQSF
jgi:hypothetical protein